MSQQTIDPPPDSQINYKDAVEYWSSIPATVDGVLGGFGSSVIPKVDVIGSNAFLRQLYGMSKFGQVPNEQRYAVDIGAGIGRVTKNVLSKHAFKVDLVEPVDKFVQQAKIDLQQNECNERIGEFYTIGMQEFIPEEHKYWLIWCQWCVGHLNDENFVKFLQRAANGLQPNGLIVVKENNCNSQDEFDELDSSVTRTDDKFKQLFEQANLQLVYSMKQHGMPKQVYPVTMYALRPKSANNVS